ncbi:nuclear protein 96-domain-containing protein [Cercophora newfieldiana]|uniref:Nuclear protein 96-domain-containing protein n=1 Tax=Cercophora newfieldiana TaxID=92897 RepID=A0AA39XVM4_9PEZI|nr:nuclear protein 96-domain-containing protein [Cercophora newfieldiana]
MSFGGFGSGGFGSNNTQQQTGGFGGFGATTNTGTGFGSTATPGFGAATTTNPAAGGSLFGGGATSGFGTSGFGGSGGFGAKPAFGATTTTAGTSLFGSTTATAPSTGFGAGGGFGSAATTSTTPFGGTGSSLFGANKPATTGFGTGSTGFGAGATTGGSIFGGGTTTSTGFGATANPGIGTNIGDPPGTAVVAFTPTVEKEANNSSQSNSFQNILFMEPYKKWSADELRLTDYNQGRKLGSAGGTGAFGGSGFGTSGFGATAQPATGGFGSTGSSLFGNTQPASTGFGAAATTNTGGFGGGGGLFGAKPATTGTSLFGNTTAQPAQTGGMFGGGAATGGFGATPAATTNAFGATNTATGGTGLFGSTNTAAAKPAGFSFGNTGTTGGFGSTGTPATGFGANTAATTTGTGGLFGSNTATNTGGGLFGNQQQQQPAATGFGASTGFGAQAQNTGTTGGLFGGGAQQKPGGLFGAAPAATATGTGGLFGNTGATNTGFGATNTTQQSGGLFGAKPAATGGLFGASTAQPAATGGGLFGGGATQTQQPAQGSLFGGLNQNNQQKPGGLFGSTQSTGGGLFGSQPQQQQQQQGGGLFGSTNTQQQQQGGFGNSLLGASTNSQAQQQSLSTSITDLSAYGSSTLFTGLPDDRVQNPGPLATPLASKSKAKSRSILPMYKLSPANASRFATPQKRGFGFSYSNYGSPSSPSSVASTPGGLGQSLLMGSIGRGLSKSISASNLRRSFNVEDSILTPGAFSASTSAQLTGGSGHHKRLVINRDLRSDLFTAPTKDTLTPESANGIRKLSKRVSFDTSTTESTQDTTRDDFDDGSKATEALTYPKLNNRLSGNGTNGSSATATPDMEQVKGNELAIVHEEESPAPTRTKRTSVGGTTEPGEYWMSPPIEELRAMNRNQLKKVANFVVGRENVGSVAFRVPVDLTGINVDELFDEIVVLQTRSATVYPNPAKKPPVGKGLNVPALISLEHSYPRGGPATTGRKLERHIERLRTQIPDTTFESYDKETGVWNFTVEHFTTYGLDDDDSDEETDADVTVNEGALRQQQVVKDIASPDFNPDDTFDFKRSRRAVPGAFDEGAMSDDEGSDIVQHDHRGSFEENHAPAQQWSDDESMEGAQDEYQYEAFQQHSPNGSDEEQQQDEQGVSQFDVQEPAGILRARMRALKKSTAPTKIEVAGGDDWTQILQASVRAPRTMDRATLRALNESGAVWDLKDRGSPAPQNPQTTDGGGFATSIDLMKSLFEQAKGPTQPTQASPAKGFVKWPYQQRPKVGAEEAPQVARPNWGPNELLITSTENETNLQTIEAVSPGSGAPTLSDREQAQLKQYIDTTAANGGKGGPILRDLAQGDPVWELASLLFDEDGSNLPTFWKALVGDATAQALPRAPSHEEKAIVSLAGNQVADACGHLLAAGNFRLANLISSIGTPNQDIRSQLKDWRDTNVLAEISEPIRALYELVAGNAGVCAGVKNVPMEHRVASFTISQRFHLNWMQAFALRLFYTTSTMGASGADVAQAVRSFQSDVEQGKEPELDSPLWSLLKGFAFGEFDWADSRLGWLLTKAIYTTKKISFGPDAAEKLDRASVSFASVLTAQSHWVPATFVLLQLSDPSSREAAIRDHLGRHAHLIGSPRNPNSPFPELRTFGVPESWIWEAKALDFRTNHDSRQEFLALVWAGNYAEANRAFLNRVGPDLVIERDYKRLFTYAELLYKVKNNISGWEQGAAVYLLYPMAISQVGGKRKEFDHLDDLLFNGLEVLRESTHGDIHQEAAIADMAEELIRFKGGNSKLYQLLPEDVKGRYMRTQALDNIR